QHLKGDRAIWVITVVLGLFSILAVYSAAGSEAFKNRGGNTEYYLVQQIVFITLGFGLTYICYNLHYMQYSRFAPLLLAIAFPLLVYTIFFGTEINEARRWITIPWIDKTIQTSDVAKLALIIFIARSLSKRQDYIKDFRSAFLPIIFPVTIVCMLIVPADLSTAGLLFLTCLLMMFIGRVSMKYISLLLVVGIIGFLVVLALGQVFPEVVRITTWETRISDFITGDGYQVEQSKIAIANGGWIGVGPGNSFQRNYLPYSYADFIYSIICEEYGLIGGFIILGMYFWLLWRCIGIVTRCPKAFGAILAMGLCLNIVIQAFANIAVSVQLVPATGLTLPLVSMGGTSILFTCISLGIILSVSRYVEEAQLQKVALTEIEDRDANSM
ncbi:MAG: putative peptidoglycan glycosyltransferase FtsW, partial [Bacteroidota bacterium]